MRRIRKERPSIYAHVGFTTTILCFVLLAVASLWTRPTFSQGKPVEKSDDLAKVQARVHFEKGVELFKNEDYEGALVEFQAAYNAQPHYRVRYNIGVCYYKLHRYADAVNDLKAYLKEGKDEIEPEKGMEVRIILDEIESFVGAAFFISNVEGAGVYIDDEFITALPDPTAHRLDVGKHRIIVKADGFETWSEVIDIVGGTSIAVEVTLNEIRVIRRVHPNVFWTLLGTSAAVATVAAITGGVYLNEKKTYSSLSYCSDWKDQKQKIQNLSVASNVLWTATGAIAVSTFLLSFFTKFNKTDKDEQEAAAGALPAGTRNKLTIQYFISGVGASGVLALSAVVTGSLALKTQADYRELGVEDDWKPVQRKAKNLALATDVLWGVTGAAAIGTVVIAFFTDFEASDYKEAGLTLTPTIGTPGLSLQGVF